MGARPHYTTPERHAASSPSMVPASLPVSRKRRFMDVVLDHHHHDLMAMASVSKRTKVDAAVHIRSASPLQARHAQDVTSPMNSPVATSSSLSTVPVSSSRPNMSASQTITLEMLRPHFEKPLAHVAQVFGICVTLLKKICRKNGLARWPHRQIIGLRKSISSMEQAIDHFEGARRDSYAQQLEKQRNKLTALLKDPTSCDSVATENDAPSSTTPVTERYAFQPAAEYTSSPIKQVHHEPHSTYGMRYAPTEPLYSTQSPQHDYYYAQEKYTSPSAVHHELPQHAYHHTEPHQSTATYYNYARPAVHAVTHPMRAPAVSSPIYLPPLRVDARPALPPISALFKQHW